MMLLQIWLPEPLSPADNSAASALWAEQIAAFEAVNSDVAVRVRLKRPSDVGGILATLRTASAVAPGALPDLTLLRRADLLSAHQYRLLQSLQNRSSAPSLDDMQPTTARLGQIDGDFYGVPYLVDALHMAYYPAFAAPESWTFAGIFASGVRLTLPVGRTSGRSDLLTAQYLAMSRAQSSLDADALLALLRFYDRAVDEGLIDPLSLDYAAPSDYRARIASGEVRAGVVSSTGFLALRAGGADVQFAPLPTADGALVTPLDGWVWVLTTTDADRQEAALRLLNWLMNSDRQARMSQTLGMLPSQRGALRLWNVPQEPENYPAFADSLLAAAVLPESLPAPTARALHTALIAVLTGERTAEQAVQDVIALVGG
jgi:ABC-type glycerol-3-phosphate transport system substrate-binding protein